MAINIREKAVLQELAKRYAQLAAMPIQKERRDRARDINDLKPRKPIVWLDEIPWHEMDIDGKLTLTCEDEFARQMEWFFRSALYRWEFIQADMVVEPYFPISKSHTISDMGIEVQEHQLSTDNQNHIVSHSYMDQLDTMEKVAALKEPVVTANAALDAQRMAWANDILGDILPAKLEGYYYYHAPWDNIPRYRGVMPIMMDMIDRPELLHATIKKFSDYGLSVMKQMEALQLLESQVSNLHCTPGYVSGLEPESGPAKLKNMWFRTMAQMFSEISPDMLEEFDLQYSKPLAAECGLTYYGCCEPLDNKMHLIKTIPNLRKIGVPTRSNPEVCAEQIGGDYVFAHKPNPAFVSGTFEAEPVRDEIARVIEACQKYGCPYEFVLKDISTAGYRPQNMIDWVNVVMETVNRYY